MGTEFLSPYPYPWGSIAIPKADLKNGDIFTQETCNIRGRHLPESVRAGCPSVCERRRRPTGPTRRNSSVASPAPGRADPRQRRPPARHCRWSCHWSTARRWHRLFHCTSYGPTTRPQLHPGHLHQYHTHPFNGPALFPGLPGRAGTRKVKPIGILLKQETVSGSGISWAICKSASRSREITMPAPQNSSFLQAGYHSCSPTDSVKALKASASVPQINKSTNQPIENFSAGPSHRITSGSSEGGEVRQSPVSG